MMQFIASNKLVQCPVCDILLTVTREIDQRVAHMQHPRFAQCSRAGKHYRVDRNTGHAEELVIHEKPAEVQFSSGGVAP
jgi:hypothetical protein